MTDREEWLKKCNIRIISEDICDEESIWLELRIQFFNKIDHKFDQNDMIHMDHISDALDSLLWNHIELKK